MKRKQSLSSDLATEIADAKHEKSTFGGYNITHSQHTNGSAISLDVAEADIETESSRKHTARALGELIAHNFPNEIARSIAPVTVICIGNSSFTADSLGPLCAEKIIATRHLKRERPQIFSMLGGREISVLRTETASFCGIDAKELAKMCINELGSSLIITVDSLKAASPERLYKTVQISDRISPGSGIGNDRPSISKDTLGVPVISIGVPTVICASSLIPNGKNRSTIAPATFQTANLEKLLVTPIDTDIAIKRFSAVIGGAINHALLGIDDDI